MPFTFDSDRADRGAGRAGERVRAARRSSPAPLPAPPHDDVALADLIGFFKDPVKGFFRALDYTLPWDVDGVEDAMPVEIDALEEWTVGDRMLDDMLRGMTPDDARQAEWRRGTLPPGQLGWRKAERDCASSRRCSPSTAQAPPHGRRATRYDVDIDLGAGRRVTGTVSPVFGDRLVVGHLLQARRQASAGIVDSVAGVVRPASGPGVVGGLHRTAEARRHAQRAAARARRRIRPSTLLRDLVAIYDAGRREPLPLPVKTSYAWAVPATRAATPSGRRGSSGSPASYPGEDSEPAQVRAWGPNAWLRI